MTLWDTLLLEAKCGCGFYRRALPKQQPPAGTIPFAGQDVTLFEIELSCPSCGEPVTLSSLHQGPRGTFWREERNPAE